MTSVLIYNVQLELCKGVQQTTGYFAVFPAQFYSHFWHYCALYRYFMNWIMSTKFPVLNVTKFYNYCMSAIYCQSTAHRSTLSMNMS